MSARHSHRWLAWLLPLFLLRSFVPVGFMLSWSDQGLQLVVCSGSGPMTLPGPEAKQHGQHTDSHAAGGHEHSQAHEGSMCPFAAAGTTGALPTFAATVAFVTAISHEVPSPPASGLPSSTFLIDRIRGPPSA